MSDRPKFFSKEGKSLHPLNIPTVDAFFSKQNSSETISSLLDQLPQNGIDLNKKQKTSKIFQYLNKFVDTMPVQKYTLAGITCALLIFTGISVHASVVPKRYDISKQTGGYHIFSSKPLTYDEAVSEIQTKDSRSQKIDGVFNYYNCPMEGLGPKFVEEADKHGIPWWLVASVAFKESSCGKNTPKVNGQESYNAWGWGVYGDNTHAFDNFARGIETVSHYFMERFYSKGMTDLCEIMKVYTPPSDGSWCRDVGHFGNIFEQYHSL